jgi:hypothetical protein
MIDYSMLRNPAAKKRASAAKERTRTVPRKIRVVEEAEEDEDDDTIFESQIW